MAPIFRRNKAFDVAQQGFDDLINVLGKKCLLVFPGVTNPCVNCVYDSVGQKSSNHFAHGGPLPFPNGTACPMCNGEGMRQDKPTKEVKLLLLFEPKVYVDPSDNRLNIRIPDAILETRGRIEDWPDVEQCEYLIAQSDIQGYGPRKFKLASEPSDDNNISQGRYFVARWERTN